MVHRQSIRRTQFRRRRNIGHPDNPFRIASSALGEQHSRRKLQALSGHVDSQTGWKPILQYAVTESRQVHDGHPQANRGIRHSDDPDPKLQRRVS